MEYRLINKKKDIDNYEIADLHKKRKKIFERAKEIEDECANIVQRYNRLIEEYIRRGIVVLTIEI